MLVYFLQHDDDDPEDIPTEVLPIGKSSVGILGVCHDHHDHHDDLHLALISLCLIRPSAGVARGAQRC